uniref:Putative tick salivary metalloprotease n=1 Tax=Rhipicephalus pulchellus TaxID=72859 RepID=L7LQK3_RHIPC
MSDNSAKYRSLARRFATVTSHYTILSLLPIQSCFGFIVYPKILESRVEGGPLTLHVHAGLILTLEKSSILANNLHFVSSSHEGSNAILLNGQDLQRNLYHSTTKMSSLIVEQLPGGVEVRGILTYRHRISPLLASRSSDGDFLHVIEETEENTESELDEGSLQGSDDSIDLHCASFTMEHPPTTPQSHELFIVEVCVVVSKNYSAEFDSREDLVKYVGAMFNWAAIPYFEIERPRIRFQINAVIEVEDDFLFRNKTCWTSTDTFKYDVNASVCGYNAEETINNTADVNASVCGYNAEESINNTADANASVCGYDAAETINNTADYVNACFHGNCDIIFHLTREEIFFIRNGTVNTQVSGLTTAAGVCSVERFAVGEDIPHTYNGRVTMAHEIGHLLGCVHDGCPKALNCSHEYGNLMSPLTLDIQNKSKLSECCKSRIQELVSVLPQRCINVSTSANYTNDFLPGENITEEEFCNFMHPGEQVLPRQKNNTMECHINCCWNETSEEYSYSGEYSEDESTTEHQNNRPFDDYCWPDAMLDGMECGENKTCYRSNCSNHNWTEITLKYHTLRTFP